MVTISQSRRGALRYASLPLLFALGLAGITLVGAAPKQGVSCEQGENPSGCVDVSLSPDTLTGDFFVDEIPMASGANPAHLHVSPSTTVRVEARNIRDGSEEYGDVYVYADSAISVWVSAGQTRGYTLYPRKTFIKGFLNLTRDIRSMRRLLWLGSGD